MISIPNDISDSEKKFLMDLKEWIGDDKQWVFELFNLVDKKSKSVFIELEICSFEEDDESSKKFTELSYAVLYSIFWSALLRIYNTRGGQFLTLDIKELKKHWPKEKFEGIRQLDVKIPQRLVKKSINQLINEYLSFVKLFLDFIKKDRNYSFNAYMDLFRDKTKLEIDLEKMVKLGLIPNHLLYSNKKNKKGKPGRTPMFTREELIAKIRSLPEDAYKSQSELARKIGMKESTFRDNLERYKIDPNEIIN